MHYRFHLQLTATLVELYHLAKMFWQQLPRPISSTLVAKHFLRSLPSVCCQTARGLKIHISKPFAKRVR